MGVSAMSVSKASDWDRRKTDATEASVGDCGTQSCFSSRRGVRNCNAETGSEMGDNQLHGSGGRPLSFFFLLCQWGRPFEFDSIGAL
jgi:hypothetical protein